MKKSKFSDSQIMQALKRVEAGRHCSRMHERDVAINQARRNFQPRNGGWMRLPVP